MREDVILSEKHINNSVLVLASVASMIDQFNMSNIELLIKLGYKVDVACNFEQGSTCSDEKIVDLKKRLSELGVDYYQIDFTRNVTNIFKDIQAHNQVKKLVSKNEYNFIHCHSPIGGVVGRMVAHETQTKVIYTAHGFHFYDGAPKKNWMIYYPIEKFLSKWTDVLITINNEDYERAKKDFYAKETIYVPGIGIDTARFKTVIVDSLQKRKELGIEESDIMLLSVGELSERKNHEVVIRALKEIDDSHIKYFIVGKGELENYLSSLIEQLGMKNQVRLLGFRTDISELCHTADLFVFPSHQEGLPVALMEAIASKTLVIASKIRGNVDLLKNENYLFNQCDITDVKNKINYALSIISKNEDNTQIICNYEMLSSFDLRIVEYKSKQIYEKIGGSDLARLVQRKKLCRQLEIPFNSTIVLSVGELNDNKNHQIIVKAIAAMQDKSIQYIIAGTGNKETDLLKLSTELGIEDQVHLIGFRTDIPQIMLAADIYCLPSKREGLNVSLMEAMATGLPVVASRIRGNVDLIVDGVGGELCNANDVYDFKMKILSLKDGNRRRQFGMNNLLKINEFSLKEVSDKMKEIYSK